MLHIAAMLFLLSGAGGCANASRTCRPDEIQPGYREEGLAVWYGPEHHGRSTASGERFDMNLLTAAHLRLPFHTLVEVHNLKNDRKVTVRINDRGPYGNKARIIDVSLAAARQLNFVNTGVVPVRLTVIGRAAPRSRRQPERPVATLDAPRTTVTGDGRAGTLTDVATVAEAEQALD